ncbi:MAG: hypothetical protein GTO63_07940 [Anaerolineae bacterium]|nr:hypothetical protein [Anaerolineae bacterium]NIN94860.1 hypothetical protein [Anaerolineae bacterium]NIQ77911.1 hypothetical protein [Anaerolineae bacterium]
MEKKLDPLKMVREAARARRKARKGGNAEEIEIADRSYRNAQKGYDMLVGRKSTDGK